MNICRFIDAKDNVRVGLVAQTASPALSETASQLYDEMLAQAAVLDLTTAGINHLTPLLESKDPLADLSKLDVNRLPHFPLNEVRLCPPVECQEVWAAGVTYARSKHARMEESDFSANAYDRVYEAQRPELFFKSLPAKVVGTGDQVGMRRDSRWNVPEPELALVLDSHGCVVGYTIGNDMSSRDIEGENLLYLPQAKIYSRSCALGPWIRLGASEAEVREWTISLEIKRNATICFRDQTSISRIRRGFDELASFLFKSQTFAHGAVLLTGTGIVPPESFTLQKGDSVRIGISGIGFLENTVTEV